MEYSGIKQGFFKNHRNMKRITKGHPGYLKQKKTRLLIRSMILLLGILLLVLTGIKVTGSRKNYLTIFGALTSIPFAMQLTNLLVLLKYKGPESEEFNEIKQIVKNGVLDTELVIPNKSGPSFYFKYVYFHESGVYIFRQEGPRERNKLSDKDITDYLRLFFNGHSLDPKMYIFMDFEKYKKRLSMLKESDRDSCEDAILEAEGVLRAVSM